MSDRDGVPEDYFERPARGPLGKLLKRLLDPFVLDDEDVDADVTPTVVDGDIDVDEE